MAVWLCFASVAQRSGLARVDFPIRLGELCLLETSCAACVDVLIRPARVVRAVLSSARVDAPIQFVGVVLVLFFSFFLVMASYGHSPLYIVPTISIETHSSSVVC